MDQPAATDSSPVTRLPGARAALILLLAINLFNYVDRSILYSLTSTIQKEFGTTNRAMGLLVTAFLVTYMLIAPVFGWLGDRWRRWVLIGIGVILWSLASGGSGLATSYGMLLLMRCLIGVGEAAYGPVAPTLISDLYPVASRGKVLAWFYAAIPVGSAIGYMLGGLFAQPGRWHWAFLLTVPPGILLGVLCFVMREPQRGQSDANQMHTPVTRPPAPRASIKQYLGFFRIRSYLLNTAGMTAMTFAIGGLAAWMPTYLEKERGLSAQSASTTFGGIIVVAGLAATILGGLAGDALRSRYKGSYFLVSGLGMLAGFPLFLLILVTPFPACWVVIFFAVFALFFNTGPSNTIIANVIPAGARAAAFALNILIIHALGDALSPTLIGWIADVSSFKIGFVVVSFTIAVGGVFWLLGCKHLEQDTLRAAGG
ncbi:MAG: MFS transporter [Burkholderiales bacterium]|nr:MFS transporter [Phycisphaerae bacterium]